LFQDVN